MQIAERCSPNFDARPGGVDMLILHYTGMRTAKEALDRLCDPAAKVSAHYLVDEDGAVTWLVAEEKRAWHAGISSWRGRSDINGASVGIELVNPGHEFGYRRFPEPQMAALDTLAKAILGRHPIPARHVIGHSDVAPLRKQDPGELFDWQRLARAGIGFWPDFAAQRVEKPIGLREIQASLAEIGYFCPQSGALDATTTAAIVAFQRHFRPERCDGALDAETVHRIAICAQEISRPRLT
ncbi:MAG TPA: N-acetylmuramoyl-L-alanine amidase [Stellaceae bacterium]|jgi:N-acetylmuramoyl-L-alanine amidase|nr:N-acetylmuramoyl-L-alanine amidase [Stellaceae bacterium]